MVETTNITKQQRGFQYQIWLMLLIVGGVILAGFLMVPKTELQRQQMISIMGTTNLGELVKSTLDFAPLLSGVEVTEKPTCKICIAGGAGCDYV